MLHYVRSLLGEISSVTAFKVLTESWNCWMQLLNCSIFCFYDVLTMTTAAVNMYGQNAQMQGLGQAQRALLGTIADGLAAIDDSKSQLQSRADLPPLGTDPVSYIWKYCHKLEVYHAYLSKTYKTQPLCCLSCLGWSTWLSGRTSVSGQRSFTVLRSTCSWWVTTYVVKPSAIGQPTRPTQRFILLGSINE